MRVVEKMNPKREKIVSKLERESCVKFQIKNKINFGIERTIFYFSPFLESFDPKKEMWICPNKHLRSLDIKDLSLRSWEQVANDAAQKSNLYQDIVKEYNNKFAQVGSKQLTHSTWNVGVVRPNGIIVKS